VTGSAEAVIAVIDSGIDCRHPDLAENIWQNGGEVADNGLDDDGNGFVDDVRGWDFVDDDNDPLDFLGHGTNTAGIIGAVGNNGTGMTGVAWNVGLMNLKIMDSFGVGTTAGAIAAIEYAGANGALLINASWGDSEFSQALKDAISGFDGLFITSAGNSAGDIDADPLYPAGYDLDNIVAVAGSDMDDQLASFSNYGAVSVDLAAPAVNNYTTVMIRETLWEDDFEDGDISDWETGGAPDEWGVESIDPINGSYALADSPGVDYEADADNWAVAPVLNAVNGRGLLLQFRLSGSSQYEHDLIGLEVSTDNSNWAELDFYVPGIGSLSTISGGATNLSVYADLSSYDGSAALYFRFTFVSDATTEDSGWVIDDVVVTSVAADYDGSEYGYGGGTSAATAYVGGVAGLLLSVNPEAGSAAVKSALLEGVDQNAGLAGKMVSGGRINAFNALAILDNDGDGQPDIYDDCPQDPEKIVPGECGCGAADTDADGDGVADCVDNCPYTVNPDQVDRDGDGVGDACSYGGGSGSGGSGGCFLEILRE
jgi:subtilisin family serine protease